MRDSGIGWPGADARHEGFGLHQVHERLATRYGSTARLDIGAAEGGGTLATLTLPIETP